MDTSAQMLTPGVVAKRLQVHLRTLTAWRRRGEGPPYVQYSRTVVRYPDDLLAKWLELNRGGDAVTG